MKIKFIIQIISIFLIQTLYGQLNQNIINIQGGHKWEKELFTKHSISSVRKTQYTNRKGKRRNAVRVEYTKLNISGLPILKNVKIGYFWISENIESFFYNQEQQLVKHIDLWHHPLTKSSEIRTFDYLTNDKEVKVQIDVSYRKPAYKSNAHYLLDEGIVVAQITEKDTIYFSYDPTDTFIYRINSKKDTTNIATYDEFGNLFVYEMSGIVRYEYQYDSKGNCVRVDTKYDDTVSFDSWNINKHDEEGNTIERIHYNSVGEFENRFTFEYYNGLIISEIRFNRRNKVDYKIVYEYTFF